MFSIFSPVTGVYAHFFHIIDKKYRLWVLVRPASLRLKQFLQVPTIHVLHKNKNVSPPFNLKIVILTAVKVTIYCIRPKEKICVFPVTSPK